jgi:hypothetical protein
MKFYFITTKNKWTFNIIPSIHLYFETNQPSNHRNFWKGGINGLYLSFEWGNFHLTTGIFKKLKYK